MRVLAFTGEDGELFEDLYGALQVGERYIRGVKDQRSVIKAYDALDAISAEIVGTGRRRLHEAGGTVQLENADFDVFQRAVKTVLEDGNNAMTPATNIAYRGIDARRSVRALEFVEKAETVEINRKEEAAN